MAKKSYSEVNEKHNKFSKILRDFKFLFFNKNKDLTKEEKDLINRFCSTFLKTMRIELFVLDNRYKTAFIKGAFQIIIFLIFYYIVFCVLKNIIF